jgi:hypothetical protein
MRRIDAAATTVEKLLRQPCDVAVSDDLPVADAEMHVRNRHPGDVYVIGCGVRGAAHHEQGKQAGGDAIHSANLG